MKRLVVYTFLILFVSLSKQSSAQTITFWYESFGLGCTQYNLANGSVPTVTNSAWAVTALGSGPGNGANPNEWYVSATEAGRPVGICNDGCLNNAGLTNRSLHIGISAPPGPPQQDAGATYLATAASTTNKRAESNFINCTGRNNITFSFTYFANANVTDFGEALYSDNAGVTWNVLGPIVTTLGGGCAAPSVGTWAAQSYLLPATCDGNPNVKVGFRWQNSSVGPPGISVAVDELMLTCPALSFTPPLYGCPGVCFTPSVIAPFIVPAPTSYSWSTNPPPTSINNITTPQPCITVPTTGIYTITGYAMSGAVITASTTQTISIVTSVPFTLTAAPSTICLGDNTQLTAFGGLSYTWSPGGSLNTTVGCCPVATPSFATTYTAIGIDASGCPGIGTLLVNLGQAPVISVAATASAVCAGFASTLTASGACNYTWTGTSLPIAVVNASVAVGPGTYTVIAQCPAFPCTTSSVIVIGLAPPLTINTSQNSLTTCIASNFPLYSLPVTLNASGASVYNWNPGSSLNYSIGPSVLARPPVSTCYTVTGLTSVCMGTAIICVTVIPQYTIQVKPKQPILCIGDSLKMWVNSIGTTAIAPFTYVWTEPANAPPPSIDNPLAGTIQISPTNTTSAITYTTEVYDVRGCVSQPALETTSVLAQPQIAIAIPTLVLPSGPVVTNSVCYLGSTTGDPSGVIQYEAVFTNSAAVPPGVIPTYTWIPPYNPPYVPFLSPINNYTILLSAPLRTPAVAVYTLRTGYNGIQGCNRLDTVSVRVIDCRAITIAGVQFTTALNNDTICSRTCITFLNLSDTAAGGPQTYTWNCVGGNPQYSNLQNPTICYNLPGSYNVVLTVHSPYTKPGAGSTATRGVQKFIKVVDIPNPKILPLVAFPKDTIIRFGTSVALTATNALSYEWSPAYHISSLTGSHVTVSPLHTTQYVLQGFNSKNCYSRDTLNVIVIEDCGEMFVPNAFSPNGDGYNDELKVRGLCLESLTFMVFNRWGEKVFETTDREKGWDGTYKGELMNTQVFVFRLEGKTYAGNGYSLKGNVTLMR